MTAPIKLKFKTEILPVFFVIAALVASFYFYSRFPERVASHWNFAGQVDSYSSRAVGAFTVPTMMLGMYLLFLGLPYLDPKRERYQEFAGVYGLFKTAVLGLLFIIYLASGFYNLGYPVQIGVVTPVAIGIMFILMGNYMGKIKFNWFVGIRTPWTLSSETVWNKTHRLGGWLFFILGIVMILTPYLPEIWAMPLFFIAILTMVMGTFIYSYIVYRQEKNRPE